MSTRAHDAADAFVLRLGRALHTQGYPAPTLEEETHLSRAAPGEVDLAKLAATSLVAGR